MAWFLLPQSPANLMAFNEVGPQHGRERKRESIREKEINREQIAERNCERISLGVIWGLGI